MTIRRALFGLGSVAVAAAFAFGLAGAATAQTTDPSFRLNNRAEHATVALQVSSSDDSN